MTLNFASAVVLFVWGAPFTIAGGYRWRHAERISSARLATDEDERGEYGGFRLFWRWQRSVAAVRVESTIWGVAGITCLVGALLKLLSVIPPLF